MKLRLEQITVRSYHSGENEDELRPFELPEGAEIVKIYRGYEGREDWPYARIDYTVPA